MGHFKRSLTILFPFLSFSLASRVCSLCLLLSRERGLNDAERILLCSCSDAGDSMMMMMMMGCDDDELDGISG